MSDTINRQIYGRMFKGAYQSISDTAQSDFIGAVFDKTLMPALLIAPGKQSYQAFTLPQDGSFEVPLPIDYDMAERLYIAVKASKKASVLYDSPTHGNGNVALLNATDSTALGTHAAFWSYQGDISSLEILVPSTANGGDTTDFQVFMYEIPDLDDFESYFDKQIGLGVSGNE